MQLAALQHSTAHDTTCADANCICICCLLSDVLGTGYSCLQLKISLLNTSAAQLLTV
jgi:hypothetical protein